MSALSCCSLFRMVPAHEHSRVTDQSEISHGKWRFGEVETGHTPDLIGLLPVLHTRRWFEEEAPMPSELILYTHDKHWMVEVTALTHKSYRYKVIGTYVSVYHQEHTTSIWGANVIRWEATPAELIRIHNVYAGNGPAVATRDHEWRHATEAELKEWSIGGPIFFHAGTPASQEGAEGLDIHDLQGTVTVVIGNETLTGTVSSSPIDIVTPMAA